MAKQLTEQDAMFLYFETAEPPTHVGGLSLVTLPDGYRGNFFEDYKATIASRMALIPFHGQAMNITVMLGYHNRPEDNPVLAPMLPSDL